MFLEKTRASPEAISDAIANAITDEPIFEDEPYWLQKM